MLLRTCIVLNAPLLPIPPAVCNAVYDAVGVRIDDLRGLAAVVFVEHGGAPAGIGRHLAARLNEIGLVGDHGREVALAGTAEIPILDVFVVLAVFIAGLMVGRTPEYLGKKIEAYDVKMAMLVVLVFPLVILLFSAISSVKGFGTSSILNHGPHGLSEILYAFTSQAGNNGSAFAGLTTNTPWYNVAGGITMLVGRFLMIIPMLAIAGNLARKKYVPPSLGTFPVTTPLFTVLLIGVIVIVGALTFFPALSLGPVLEHLLMHAGKTF